MFKVGDHVILRLRPIEYALVKEGYKPCDNPEIPADGTKGVITKYHSLTLAGHHRWVVLFEGAKREWNPIEEVLEKIDPPRPKEELTTWGVIEQICGYKPKRLTAPA